VSDTRRVSALPTIEFAQRTDPGRDPDKQVNEDAAEYRETRFGHLCVLCDGMGGHLSGREASNLALKTILDAFEAAPLDARATVASPVIPADSIGASGPVHALRPPEPGVPSGSRDLPGARGRELLRDAIEAANRKVFALGGAAGGSPRAHRPGSTVVAILVHQGGAEIAHVGDSRCYMIHGAQIFQVTKDHSIVQQMVDAQVLTPAQAATHPDANKITRALGTLQDVEVEVRAQPVAYVAGDAFILCSDGLSDLVEAPEILQIAGAAPPAQAVGQLVDLANARGGHDNITVQVLRPRESATGPREPVSPTVAQTVVQPYIAPGAAGARPSGGPVVPSSPLGTSTVSPPSGPSPLSAPSSSLTMTGDEAPSRRLDSGPPARRVPASVIVGVVLGVVGLIVAAVAIYLELSSHRSTRAVAPFALTAPSATTAAPRASMVPLAPTVSPTGAVEPSATVAPLPSLVPSPKLK
jgi:serine/threonine protein phosphatase PrpC